MNCLVLGDGLLGSEIRKQTNWDYLSRKKDNIDFNNPGTFFGKLRDYDVVINCIANTNTYSKDKDPHWETNYKSVSRLCDFLYGEKIKLVHISTDYVYANNENLPSELDVPVHAENWYSYTKLLADAYIELKSDNYLIVRCSHKPTPFPYSKAYSNVIGNFDYVNVIAENIIKLINNNANGVYNVGTELKSMYELAKKTIPNVLTDLAPETMPKNLNMSLDKFKYDFH